MVPHALYEAVEDMARREDQSWHSMLLRLVRRGIIETKVLHERLSLVSIQARARGATSSMICGSVLPRFQSIDRPSTGTFVQKLPCDPFSLFLGKRCRYFPDLAVGQGFELLLYHP
jgi:hypothetical protein